MSIDLKTSVSNLQAKTKAARLRALMPLIEAKVRDGIRHADIIRALNEQGFAVSEMTYRTYLKRHRQKQHSAPAQAVTRAPAVTPGVVASATSPPISSVQVAPKRPPTFEHDPRGIPDLLK